MYLSIDRDSPLPIHEQMTGQIKALIEIGELPPGEQLPTIKTMALELGVNPNTIAAAYRALEVEGYLTQRKRAGTAVTQAPPRSSASVLALRLAAEATSKARAAGVEPADLVRAVAAQGALAAAIPRLKVAVLAATELQAIRLASRTEAILGDGVECLPLTPQRYDSLQYHMTVIDPQLTELLAQRSVNPGERRLPTHLRYGPEFPAGAD